MIFTNARILTCDATNRVLDSGSVEIREDGTIGFVRPGRVRGGDPVDLGGRLLMPALINCHTHLYSALARGIPLPGRPPANFPAILKKQSTYSCRIMCDPFLHSDPLSRSYFHNTSLCVMARGQKSG